jgi:hypothetical protein
MLGDQLQAQIVKVRTANMARTGQFLIVEGIRPDCHPTATVIGAKDDLSRLLYILRDE